MYKIEMHVINEQEMHLKEIIVDIGVRLRTSTLSESIRRLNIGPFHIQHSLVIDEITPSSLINNIDTIEQMIEENHLLDTTILVNRTHQDETKLLGKQIDQTSVDLYKNKRPINYQWKVDPNQDSR